ncbi:hypothetical protein AHAS_Ahas14G0171500 [Arachis hypogaea]
MKVLTGRASHEVLLRIAHALHDLVATPDLVNKADVESMGRNGYENPSLPTVPETHYVEIASHRYLRNEVNKLEERLGVTDDHLKQKNLNIKKLTDEKKCALATQYAAEATLRRVYANQKDDDILPIDSIITPFEAEIKIYKNELQIM